MEVSHKVLFEVGDSNRFVNILIYILCDKYSEWDCWIRWQFCFNCQLTHERLNKTWYIHRMEYYLDLEKEGNPIMSQHG